MSSLAVLPARFMKKNYAQFPRATKDIDIILIVEALSHEFVKRFWSFIRQGAYQQREKGTGGIGRLQHEYYRFIKPQVASYSNQRIFFNSYPTFLAS